MADLESSLTAIDWLSRLSVGAVNSVGNRDNSESGQDGGDGDMDSDGEDCGGPGHESKPAYSYANLITFAIKSSPEKRMTLSEIYQWICDKYPYYRDAGNGWKVSGYARYYFICYLFHHNRLICLCSYGLLSTFPCLTHRKRNHEASSLADIDLRCTFFKCALLHNNLMKYRLSLMLVLMFMVSKQNAIIGMQMHTAQWMFDGRNHSSLVHCIYNTDITCLIRLLPTILSVYKLYLLKMCLKQP